MNDATFQFVIARVVKNALEAKEDYNAAKNDPFQAGRHMAYYEVLDTLRSELLVHEESLKGYGLDFDLENQYI